MGGGGGGGISFSKKNKKKNISDLIQVMDCGAPACNYGVFTMFFFILQTALEAGNIADFDADAWEEDSDDDFLDNDDPLAAERWDLS